MEHETVDIDLHGTATPVDRMIAADVTAMNARGLRTSYSCQGDDPAPGTKIGVAYVTFSDAAVGIAPVLRTAKAAGLHVTRDAIYATPNDHHDAVRELATSDDLRRWNARFRSLLADAGAGTLDDTGDRYRSAWDVHPCVVREDGAYIDTDLLSAYTALTHSGVPVTALCAGDQTARSTGRYVIAGARWRITTHDVSLHLVAALIAIRFEVRPWGIFTLRGVRGSASVASVPVTPARIIAMNRVFHRILVDYGADGLRDNVDYARAVVLEQRAINRG